MLVTSVAFPETQYFLLNFNWLFSTTYYNWEPKASFFLFILLFFFFFLFWASIISRNAVTYKIPFILVQNPLLTLADTLYFLKQSNIWPWFNEGGNCGIDGGSGEESVVLDACGYVHPRVTV